MCNFIIQRFELIEAQINIVGKGAHRVEEATTCSFISPFSSIIFLKLMHLLPGGIRHHNYIEGRGFLLLEHGFNLWSTKVIGSLATLVSRLAAER